jgi:hypothetical protein
VAAALQLKPDPLASTVEMDNATMAFVPGWHPGGWWLLEPLQVLLAIAGFTAMSYAALSNGGPVDKPNRIKQLYGYTVCLVAVITGLVSTASVVDNVIDLSNPLAVERGFTEASLTSFESYRATRNRFSFAREGPPVVDTTSEATLRARYDALRTDQISVQNFRARKGAVSAAILLLLAVVLFVSHWRWLRGLPDLPPGL